MSIFLLHGNHSFARKKAKAEVVNQCSANGVAITSFSVPFDLSSKNPLIERIRQKLTGSSLFPQSETVVVDFTLGDNARRKKTLSLPTDFIVDFFPQLSGDITLVLDVPVVLAKSSALYKKTSKLGGNIQLFKLPPLKDKAVLLTEAKKFLAKENIQLDSYLVQKLVDNAKGDWWYVFTALEQVVLLSHARVETGHAPSLQELWNLQEDQSIFRLFDAIGQGNKAVALRILYENNAKESLRSGKDVEQTLGFVSLMARQLRQLIAVKSDISSSEAQKDWQIPAFAYSKIKYQAAYFSSEFLAQAYEKLTELQEKAKRGLYSPLSLVDFFILYLISHRRPEPSGSGWRPQ